MQFSELVQMVMRTTKRPDKIVDIKDAINGAIEYFSLTAEFSQDLYEFTHILNDPDSYTQNLVIATVFTRYRSMKYMKRTSATGYINWIDPQNVFVNGCEQLDHWYRSGNNIIFKLRTLTNTIEIGHYRYPARLSADTDTYWMLDIIPTIIHDKAAARVFFIIGENADALRFETLAQKAFDAVQEKLEDSATHRSR